MRVCREAGQSCKNPVKCFQKVHRIPLPFVIIGCPPASLSCPPAGETNVKPPPGTVSKLLFQGFHHILRGRQPGQGTRMEGMGERAHGRQRQKRGWHGQPAPSLPQPASGGGCLPQPRWAVCATGAEPTRGRPAVRVKGTYGGRSGQSVEEQGIWASFTRKHSEAVYGRPVDRGAWTAKTVKRPRQQPAEPQYTNSWAPLTRKQHTMPHPAQPRHWAPRTRK